MRRSNSVLSTSSFFLVNILTCNYFSLGLIPDFKPHDGHPFLWLTAGTINLRIGFQCPCRAYPKITALPIRPRGYSLTVFHSGTLLTGVPSLIPGGMRWAYFAFCSCLDSSTFFLLSRKSKGSVKKAKTALTSMASPIPSTKDCF